MKSSVAERDRDLIFDLVRRRISDAEFLGATKASLGPPDEAAARMLSGALVPRDALAVELGLYVGHRFGFRPDTLETLLKLAVADWHERHEDVVDAIAKLRAPESAGALERVALSALPYREYDDARSLRSKAVRAIAALNTLDAVSILRDVARPENQHAGAKAKAIVAAEAKKFLRRLAATAESDEVRAAARSALTDLQ